MNREDKFIHFFSHLTVDNIDQINDIYTPNAHFKDPFNDVIGVTAIKSVFSHMFETTESPIFIINHHASNQRQLFVQWCFNFTKNNKKWSIDGSSMITFNDNDQVEEHLDFWDPAEQIYSKIGFLKPFMNFIKSKLTAT